MKKLSKLNEGTLWGNTIMRSDTDKVRKEDEVTEDLVYSILDTEFNKQRVGKVTIRKENGKYVVYIEKDFVIRNDISEIPFQFGKVGGSFWCKRCNLTSLKGCPREVGGDFSCSYCANLTSLEGSPDEVCGDFYCRCCGLTSLECSPKWVGGTFFCSDNPNLTSLEGCPENVGRNFNCSNCGKKFTEKEVKKHCTVGRHIFVI